MRHWRNTLILYGLALALPMCVQAETVAPSCERIVSLSPSVTETLYALGLGEQVTGVTRYCRYPPEAQAKPKIGGFLDPNNEVILSLKPSLVITVGEQEAERNFLTHLGMRTLSVDHKSISGILNSLDVIGERCGKKREAAALRETLEATLHALKEARAHLPRERVLIAVGGNEQDGVLAHLFISGRDGFYDQMLEIVGGENVYHGSTTTLPSLSKEGLIALNPEVIIQIGSESDGVRTDPSAIRRAWQGLEMIKAVRNGRVYVFTQDFASIPGPRFVKILEEFAKVIHPEAGGI
jgi:iron complex transport system substrate-binding protein